MGDSEDQSKKRNEALGSRLLADDRLTLDELLELMRALRTPVTGCPWDLEQSFETIAPYTLEEAYEVADAIERLDYVELRYELGDLLFQVVYHAQIADEKDLFDFGDVVDGISRKMLRRHPHVFGDENVRAATDVKGLWERVKAEEKASSPDGVDVGREYILDEVALALPSLVRAQKLQNKAAKVGFDWPDLGPVLAKLDEEMRELHEVIDKEKSNKARLQDELGDIFFALVNVARHLDIDAEQAVRGANDKMVRRFGFVEDALHEQGRSAKEAGLEEMDALWDEAKLREKEL